MRKETVGVTEALLESAQLEFLKYGYRDASLRRICANSGVSTNTIYTRFKDKAGLFNALVKPAADELMELYLKALNSAYDTNQVNQAIDYGGEGTDDTIDCIYGHYDAFKLIFCCSAGSDYEHYFDKLVDIEQQYYLEFVKRYIHDDSIDEFFVRSICKCGWQYVKEAVENDLSYDKAKQFMQSVHQFYAGGWKAFMNSQ